MPVVAHGRDGRRSARMRPRTGSTARVDGPFEPDPQSWGNASSFVRTVDPEKPHPPTGIDPVIGQSDQVPAPERERTRLDRPTMGAQPIARIFAHVVHMTGGEYFCAPVLSFVRGSGAPVPQASVVPCGSSFRGIERGSTVVVLLSRAVRSYSGRCHDAGGHVNSVSNTYELDRKARTRRITLLRKFRSEGFGKNQHLMY